MPTRRVAPDREWAAAEAAAEIVAAVNAKPDLVLALPTGHTPLAVYHRLAAACRAGAVSFKAATLLMIDEYVGLGPEDAGSFAGYLREHVLGRTDFDPERVHLLNGRAADPDAEASRYEALIKRCGGFDFLMLGVGRNGHLGFNEPGSPRASRTRVVALTAETLEANAPDLAASRAAPTHAITIGLGNVLEARHVLLVAFGRSKAEPMRQLFACDDSEKWPVAALCDHPSVVAIMDTEAAG